MLTGWNLTLLIIFAFLGTLYATALATASAPLATSDGESLFPRSAPYVNDCPPGSCTIVFKTQQGGEPSSVIAIR